MSLDELRSRIDQINEEIIENLKTRSTYFLGVPERPTEVEERVFSFYTQMLPSLCSKDGIKDPRETSRLDETILSLCNERVVGIGRLVAIDKVEKDPSILDLDSEEVRSRITDTRREKKVIESALDIAKEKGFHNPNFIRKFFEGLIYLTTETQLEYIKEHKTQVY